MMNFIEKKIKNYPYTRIDKKQSHRVIWEYHNGKIPEGYIIHHINGNMSDNRIKNLYCCTRYEHSMIHNNKYTKINGEWFKLCKSCNKLLPLTAYPYYKILNRKRLKINYRCRECDNAYQREYWEKRKLSKTNLKGLI